MGNFVRQQTMSPQELGDTLARLVWESFSDFIAEGEQDPALAGLGLARIEENPRLAEEILIFLMWAHTRAAELAFVGRSHRDLLRASLDAMHRAVFEDMADHGTPRAQLPLFEQRVSARYADYNHAADRNDTQVGLAAARHLTGRRDAPAALARALTERAIAVAGPLRDFLEEVQLAA